MDLGKDLRHRALRDLVARRAIRTQRELVSALKSQGIPATQATVSRDITELGLTKVDRGGSPAYALPAGGSVEQVAEARLSSLLADAPLEMLLDAVSELAEKSVCNCGSSSTTMRQYKQHAKIALQSLRSFAHLCKVIPASPSALKISIFLCRIVGSHIQIFI